MSGLKKKGPAHRVPRKRRAAVSGKQSRGIKVRPSRRFQHFDEFDEFDEFYD